MMTMKSSKSTIRSISLSRQDRPWAVLAVFLLFVLISLCDQKYGPKPEAIVLSTAQPHPIPTASYDIKTTTTTTTTNNALAKYLRNPPPTNFHFCTQPHILLQANNRTIEIPYQCEGPLYRAFVSHLRAYIQDVVSSGDQTALWGHRKALPANRRYLFLGNSHTRQTANALLCQLNVVDSEALDVTNKAMARRYDLDNGAQIYLVVNSYAVHSPNWVELLEQQIGLKLADFDAMVLGVFNTCNAPVNTTFTTEMVSFMNNESGVDCINVEGPSYKQVAEVYAGPIAYLSMFATYRYNTYAKDRNDWLQMRNTRSNLLYLDARQYVREMTEECGSATRDAVSDCAQDGDARRYLHRCVGPFGGHPDLLAWDTIEFFYQFAGDGEEAGGE